MNNTDIANPKIYKRSELIRISTVLNLNLYSNSSKIYLWKIFKINETDLTHNETDLTENPSALKDTLILLGFSLDYGLYQVKIFVNITQNGSDYSATNSVYLKIIPSGISVNGLENALDSIKIGTNQSLELNFLKYSFDMDYFVSTSLLEFEFYCFDIDLTMSENKFDLKSFNLTNEFNLKYFLNQNNITNPCFNTSGNLFELYL